MEDHRMFDRFGRLIQVGDTVCFASKYFDSTIMMKGKVYGLENGLVRIETFKKNYDNCHNSVDFEAEIAKSPQKVSTNPLNCAVMA